MNTTDLTPTVRIEDSTHTPDLLTVWIDYDRAGVDRPRTRGWSVPNRKIALRLKAAIEAGAVLSDARILTDVFGKTYVSEKSLILGRTMNAELKRLGF